MSSKPNTWSSDDIADLFDDAGLLNDALDFAKDHSYEAEATIGISEDYNRMRKAIVLLILKDQLDADEFLHAMDQSKAL